uniref:Uncharacterized protein n=1 Tax=Tanacetum cinerariifolium TaxID=118510 RepID=A0A6L2JT74_TANCI|nr:hypothetical protein [Tanacetum cinerariifolium]
MGMGQSEGMAQGCREWRNAGIGVRCGHTSNRPAGLARSTKLPPAPSGYPSDLSTILGWLATLPCSYPCLPIGGQRVDALEEVSIKAIAGEEFPINNTPGVDGTCCKSIEMHLLVSIAGVTISTADLEVSAVKPKTPPTTTSIFDDEDIIMAQTLIKMKEEKAKEKGMAFKEVKESNRPARSVLTLKPLPTIDPNDKRKAVLEESEPKKMTRSDLLLLGLLEMKRLLEMRLTHKEQEKYTVDERAKLLAEYFKTRKKQLAEERTTAIKNKPPTRTQLRRLRMTYLKRTEKVANFMPFGSDEDERLIQKMNEKAVDVHKEKVLEEPDSTKVLKMKAKKEGRKGDFRTMFEANAEDELWHNLEEWSLKSWNFYENCGVNILILEDGIKIHMLAERRYPLTAKTLKRMLSLRLIVESASDAAYDLLRFIQKRIDECGGYDRGEKDL